MLTVFVPNRELYNEETELFVSQPGFEVVLEHSLVSVSKWESKFEKSFLSSKTRTEEELFYYVDCMILRGDVPPDFHDRLSPDNLKEIARYMDSGQTATKFPDLPKQRGRQEEITSELIYYWLVVYQIPFEVEHWHLNRLLALVQICNRKNQKPTKKSKAELARQFRDLNEKRRAELGTSG